jgi:hypothetical protein
MYYGVLAKNTKFVPICFDSTENINWTFFEVTTPVIKQTINTMKLKYLFQKQ